MFNTSILGRKTYLFCASPSLGLCSYFWRNNNNQNQPPPSHHQQNGFIVGHEVQSSNIGIQELFQRLRSTTSKSGGYYSDHLNNVVMSSSSSCIIVFIFHVIDFGFDSGGCSGEMGYWRLPSGRQIFQQPMVHIIKSFYLRRFLLF